MKFYKNTYLSFLRKPVHMESCCLSKCTNSVHKGKNIKQVDHYTQEPGRSMVEMLGVLAIIGVLSVGGIAGYSKAMLKNKINSTLDKISAIIGRVMELKETNIRGSQGMNIKHLTSLGFECDLIKDNYNGEHCSLPIGMYRIYFTDYGNSSSSEVDSWGKSGNLLFEFPSSEAYDMCLAFVNSKIYDNVPSEWYTNEGGNIAISGPSSTTKWLRGEQIDEFNYGSLEELNAADVADLCTPCKSSKCHISWQMF